MNINESELLITPPRHTVNDTLRRHAPFETWLIRELKPDVMVELGVHRGDNFFHWCKIIKQLELPTQCYAVDTWKGEPHAGLYGDEVYRDFIGFYNTNGYSAFATPIVGTFDSALSNFDDGSIDIIHIDGYHTYEAVKHDYDTWVGKMCPNKGVMLFHDTAVTTGDFGVKQLWLELCASHPGRHYEFNQSFGLGVLGIGKDLPAEVRSLFSSGPEVAAAFARLGEIVYGS